MTVSVEDRAAYLARYDAWQSVPGMALDVLESGGDKPFLWAKDGSGEDYVSRSFAEVRRDIIALAHGLIGLGLKPGDRVVLASENRPEWLIADVAIMLAGGITVPSYTTNTEADHAHIFADSGAAGLIVTKGQIGARALTAAKLAPAITFCISLDRGESTGRVQSYQDVLAAHVDAPEPPLTLDAIERNGLSSLIYTSGTGGAPKGVMLSHRAILTNAKSALDLVFELDAVEDPADEVFLSFLPLSHAYERTAGQFLPLSFGCQLYYAESTDRLPKNLAEARPTIMTAVPRLYESMHARINQSLRKESDFKRKLFGRAVALGAKKLEGETFTMMERIEDATLESLVRSKVRERFGGRLKALVSGGAPLNYDIGLFFSALGLRLLQGYGLTEAAPFVACNRPAAMDLNTVGPPLLGVDVRIADDGEILIAGDALMDGYWGCPDDTAAVLRDGWLYTGDVGMFDESGRLMITDRKKDIIVNAGGDNVSPQRVEGALEIEEEIEQAMVYGDKRAHLVALLVPGEVFSKDWAAEHGVAEDTLLGDTAFRSAVQEGVDRANGRASNIERIRKWAFADEPFTTENGLMTSTMKIRRRFITEKYQDQLVALY